jgi:hypothetical protein
VRLQSWPILMTACVNWITQLLVIDYPACRGETALLPEFTKVKNIYCFTNSRHAVPRFSTSAQAKPYSCLSTFASLCLPRQEHRRAGCPPTAISSCDSTSGRVYTPHHHGTPRVRTLRLYLDCPQCCHLRLHQSLHIQTARSLSRARPQEKFS